MAPDSSATFVKQVTVLRPWGSLDAYGSDTVRPVILHACTLPSARVVVDLEGVDMVATPGVSLLLEGAKLSAATGGRMVVARANPLVSDTLRRLHLSSVLPLAVSVEAALAALE